MADTGIDISGMPDPDSTGVPAATAAPTASSAPTPDITGMPTPEQEFQKALGRAPSNSVELDNFLATPWAFAGENPALAKGAPTLGQSVRGAAAGVPQLAVGAGETALSMGTNMVGKAASAATKVGEAFGTDKSLDQISADAKNVEEAATYRPRTEAGQGVEQGLSDTLSMAWKNAKGPQAKAYADKALRSAVGDAEADRLEFGLGAATDYVQALPLGGVVSDVANVARKIPGAVSRAAEAAAEPSGVPGSLSRTAQQAQGKLDAATAQAQPKAAPAPSAAPAAAPAAPAAPTLSSVSPELQEGIAGGVHKAGGDVDLDTVRRHIEADTLPVPVKLTEGQATQNPSLISEEQNLRGQNPELAQRFNEQNDALKDNLEHIRTQVAPDVATTDPAAHGDTLIGSYQKMDDARVADINQKFQALRDAAGGDFPVDTGPLLGNVRGALQKELLTDHAPPSIMKVLDQAAADGKMPYESFEALRTNLATIQRTSQDGLARRAAGVIRDQIEQLPITGAASDLKPLADAARSASKARFKAIEADPAYKAVVEGNATPDDFVRKFVVNGKRDNVALMQKTLAHDPQATQTMAAAAVDHLQGKALGQTGNFSQSPYNRALQDLAPKLQHLVPGEQAGQLKAVGNVARHTQAQPRGSFVNNSNTLVGSLAKGVGTVAGEIPVVGKGAAKLLDERSRAARVKQALEPGAGVARKIERTPGGDEPPPSGGGAPKPSSPGVASATKPLGATIRGGNERGAVGADLRKQRGFLRTGDPTDVNASAPGAKGAASTEAIHRYEEEKANGQHRFQIDPDGNVTPLNGVDSVDARAPQGHLIVQRGVGESNYSILDRGGLPQGQAHGLLARAVGLGKLENRPLGARLGGGNQRGAVGDLTQRQAVTHAAQDLGTYTEHRYRTPDGKGELTVHEMPARGVRQVVTSGVNQTVRGQGWGTSMLARAAQDAHDNGQVLRSDNQVSKGQQGAYANLQKLGYKVTEHPAAVDPTTSSKIAKNKDYVYEVRPGGDNRPLGALVFGGKQRGAVGVLNRKPEPVEPATVNIGLHVGDPANGGRVMRPEEALAALKKAGANITEHSVVQSNSEPTLVASIDHPLSDAKATALSSKLKQQAIAQRYEDGTGSMHGPAVKDGTAAAQGWDQYSPEYFRMHDGRTAAEHAAEDTSFNPDALEAEGKSRQTVKNAVRNAFPGIYDDPKEILSRVQVAPEDDALHELFGVHRKDLHDIAMSREGNLPGDLPGIAKKPKGSKAAASVMTPENEDRLVSLLEEAKKNPDLYHGMTGWYVMDPLYRKVEQVVGKEAAPRAFSRLNAMMGMASPGSDVVTEINRGTAAHMMAEQGKFDKFVKYAGQAENERGRNFPPELENVKGHAYHRTAQAIPMQKFLDKGEVDMKSPKVPMYIQASGVPETGFQTRTPVGDAHWSRGVGLADVRTAQSYAGSVSNPEMAQLSSWFRDKVAKRAGLQAVPAQALQWGALSQETGVATAVGAPKLELFAQQVKKAAIRDRVTPQQKLEQIIRGTAHAG